MTKRMTAIIVGTVAGCLATVAISMCTCIIKKQRDGAALLEALSHMSVGSTSKEEFSRRVLKFTQYKSPSVASACYGGNCYKGVGYGIDNSIFGRSLFPETSLEVGAFFDSNELLQGIIVTLDRTDIASAVLEEQPESSARPPNTAESTERDSTLIHLYLDHAHEHDLTRLSISCFTSWFRCNAARNLFPEKNR
jgi:hypothetical protein